MSSLLDYAKRYVERGFPVFPLVPGEKRPATKSGFHDASCDLEQVTRWWQAGESNLGIPIPPGFVVVDVDSEEAIEMLKAQNLDLPSTVHAKTPRGHHFWFLAPEGADLKPQVGVRGADVDIRATGSYVVAPPSVVNGCIYQWITPPKPGNFTKAPEWVVESCRRDRPASSRSGESKWNGDGSAEALPAMPRHIPQGERDYTLFRHAARMRAMNYRREHAEFIIEHLAKNVCVPPFDISEAMKKVESAWKYAPGSGSEPVPSTAERPPGTLGFDVLSRPLEPIDWLCYPILHPTLSVIWAPSIAGKSTLALQLCAAVATGGKALGHLQCQQAGAYYVGYEMGSPADERRFFQHAGIQTGTLDAADFWIFGDTEIPRADAGGIDVLRDLLKLRPQVRLLVIDTLAHFWGMGKQNTSANAYYQESAALAAIKQLSDEHNICLLLVHHSTKAQKAISGTEAMRAVPRTVIHLDRPDPDSPLGVLSVAHNAAQGSKFNLSLATGTGWQIQDSGLLALHESSPYKETGW